MPDPKNNAKATGDTHPPEVEDEVKATSPNQRVEASGAEGTHLVFERPHLLRRERSCDQCSVNGV